MGTTVNLSRLGFVEALSAGAPFGIAPFHLPLCTGHVQVQAAVDNALARVVPVFVLGILEVDPSDAGDRVLDRELDRDGDLAARRSLECNFCVSYVYRCVL